jgi:uncharacterized membrane protein YedE/YeeE
MKNRPYLVFLLGIVFGFGMVIAGGCGSGSVWRAG